MTQSYMKTVYQMFIRSPRPPTFDGIVETTVLPKKRQWPESFGTLKNDSNYLVGPVFKWSSFRSRSLPPQPPPLPPQFRPYVFVVQRVSWQMAKVMKSPVQASLHVFSKTFCPKLDFFIAFIASFLQGTVIMGTDLFQLCSNCASE